MENHRPDTGLVYSLKLDSGQGSGLGQVDILQIQTSLVNGHGLLYNSTVKSPLPVQNPSSKTSPEFSLRH